MYNKPGLIANYRAVGAVLARTFVMFGAADDLVTVATAGASVLGVSSDADSADGERVDVVLTQIAPVIYGAAVTRGQRVKSDAAGHAIPAAAADDAVGRALVSGNAGDIGSVLLRG
ncbi:hypothetical protein DXT88_22140 [Herbaspirillum lusitanum]|uniref:capsid cement protein n=1 Tax=Herbaspirillum lusitanum TaxID=213312 RepID=UPI002237F964|nr:capsid cement protein [Herbaspirillum lusitanum]MCW5300876.1 hypothetical protein [Herbaspirillum lusitanum]